MLFEVAILEIPKKEKKDAGQERLALGPVFVIPPFCVKGTANKPVMGGWQTFTSATPVPGSMTYTSSTLGLNV